jgi:hypothetical protein
MHCQYVRYVQSVCLYSTGAAPQHSNTWLDTAKAARKHQHSISTASAQHQHCISTASAQHQHSISTASGQPGQPGQRAGPPLGVLLSHGALPMVLRACSDWLSFLYSPPVIPGPSRRGSTAAADAAVGEHSPGEAPCRWPEGSEILMPGLGGLLWVWCEGGRGGRGCGWVGGWVMLPLQRSEDVAGGVMSVRRTPGLPQT